jgi:hypothetical protein
MRDLTNQLRTRLARLERRRPEADSDGVRLPPQFWEVLWGSVPLDEADPETRALIEPLYKRRRRGPNPVEEAIRRAATRIPTPNCLSELPGSRSTNVDGRQ